MSYLWMCLYANLNILSHTLPHKQTHTRTHTHTQTFGAKAKLEIALLNYTLHLTCWPTHLCGLCCRSAVFWPFTLKMVEKSKLEYKQTPKLRWWLNEIKSENQLSHFQILGTWPACDDRVASRRTMRKPVFLIDRFRSVFECLIGPELLVGSPMAVPLESVDREILCNNADPFAAPEVCQVRIYVGDDLIWFASGWIDETDSFDELMSVFPPHAPLQTIKT